MKETESKRKWRRFCERWTDWPELGLALDLSRVDFSREWLDGMAKPLAAAFEEMERLEAGAIANPDENRMVGHYWLRNPELAPNSSLREAIKAAQEKIFRFADKVHEGEIHGADGRFENFLLIGIGGSALGPQFAARALGKPGRDKIRPFFLDNTDPDGIDRALAELDGQLGKTLCVVASKSGGTPETRNGMVEVSRAYEAAGLQFARHAAAITMEGSKLDELARKEGWLARFPIWDWVGGRTSETSAVGLLPAALQGIDAAALLEGARRCDEVTRQREFKDNPAARLALMWYFLGEGRGARDMVVLPYKDRLELFSRYLQQLVMESLGKKKARDGRLVYQGLTVYGNKGSTDQHAYVQQLRDGLANFFVVFIEVLKDREGDSPEVEPGATSGDYLSAFLAGTRKALYEAGRQSITVTLQDVSPFRVGVLIALFERAVGLYASLININAYDQPGVEAGKKAASGLLAIQKRVLDALRRRRGEGRTAEELAEEVHQRLAEEAQEASSKEEKARLLDLAGTASPEEIFPLCERLAANRRAGVRKLSGSSPADFRYGIEA